MEYVAKAYIVGWVVFVVVTAIAQYIARRRGSRNTEHIIGVIIASAFWPVILTMNLHDGKYKALFK